MNPSTVFVEKPIRSVRNRRNRKRKPVAKIFRPLPDKMRCRLRHRGYHATFTPTAPVVYYDYGIFEPLSRVPAYMQDLFTIWSNARIYGSTITVRLVNVGTEPIEIAIGILPANESPTFEKVAERNGSVTRLVGGASGVNLSTLTKSVVTTKLLGHEYQLSDFAFDQPQISSLIPLVADELVWKVALTSVDKLQSIQYRLEVILEWDVEFYGLNVAQ